MIRQRVYILCVLSGIALQAIAAPTVLRKLDDQSFAALSERRGAYLDIRVQSPSDLMSAVRIYSGRLEGKLTPRSVGLVAVNRKRAFLPYEQLSPAFKRLFLTKLWPEDRIKDGTLRHRVKYVGHETLWSIAAWFTGNGQSHAAIRRASNLRSNVIRKGTLIQIPESLLVPALRLEEVEIGHPMDPKSAAMTSIVSSEVVKDEKVVPVATPPQGRKGVLEEAPNKAPPILTDPARRELRYGSDTKGRYAEYQLKRGEAIYSAVVVRFCGLVSGEDVNRAAGVIIARNGIRDETDLPVGTPIRIPYDLLEAEFKQADDPEYLAYLENLKDVSKVSTKVEARNLQGVYVILDAGHGGMDPGAKFGSTWEDDYVYDILCRVKARLEKETAARVLTTTFDPSVGYSVQNVSQFKLDRDEVLLTRPKYRLNNRRVGKDGVNLRWIMTNHHYHRLLREGVKSENIVFTSFHADSLHRSIRGGMVYVPDARRYPRRVGPPHGRFKKFSEYEGNQFTFNKKTMQKAQARSMNFSKNFVAHARRQDVKIHPHKPIRSVIFRSKSRPFVPAVLNYNRVPTRCLIEVCNLNNPIDRKLIRDHRFRQRVANAYVDALYETFGITAPKTTAQLASAGK